MVCNSSTKGGEVHDNNNSMPIKSNPATRGTLPDSKWTNPSEADVLYITVAPRASLKGYGYEMMGRVAKSPKERRTSVTTWAGQWSGGSMDNRRDYSKMQTEHVVSK